jgi:hypothetical protein
MHNRDEATSVLSLSGRYHKLYLLFAALVTFMILPYCCLPLGRQHTNLDVTAFSTGPSPSRDLCIVEISILPRFASGKMSVHFPGDA